MAKSLDERLTHLEDRLDAIHELLTRLLEAQLAAVEPVREVPQPKRGKRLADESTIRMKPVEINELMSRIARERDPLDIQYDIVLNWANGSRGEDLSEFNLSGRNLRNVDLKDANLIRANLSKADLSGGKLQRANLTDADISRAQMGRTDFSKAILEQADLTFAHLSHAKLDGANLRYASLTRANLSGTNLSNADLSGAQLNRADLTRANLQNAAVTYKQLAAAGTLDSAIMPDGRIFDGNYEPWKT